MKQKNKNVAAIITAAGDGTRMGGVSKPLIRLGKKTALELVLDAFLDSKYITEIIVVCRDLAELEQVLSIYQDSKIPIKLVKGGRTRSESVFNGVSAVKRKTKLVAIHDCARPLIKTSMIDTIIETAFKNGAAAISSPVTDTIKYLNKDGEIKTPNRSSLFAVQTPQVFLKDIYFVAMAMAKRGSYTATDDTTLVEKAGFKVEYIESDEINLKLTHPKDIDIASFILSKRED